MEWIHSSTNKATIWVPPKAPWSPPSFPGLCEPHNVAVTKHPRLGGSNSRALFPPGSGSETVQGHRAKSFLVSRSRPPTQQHPPCPGLDIAPSVQISSLNAYNLSCTTSARWGRFPRRPAGGALTLYSCSCLYGAKVSSSAQVPLPDGPSPGQSLLVPAQRWFPAARRPVWGSAPP